MESSSERKFAEQHESIPGAVYEAALAASRLDSDGEDPFGPQPKRFMQTEHQKKQQRRELYVRQVALVLREERLEQNSRFGLLPPELILKVMQHSDLSSLSEFAESSVINRRIFRENEAAIYRGIETEQFPEWQWLFGSTAHRTSAQVQRLKDAVTVEYCFDASGLVCQERLLGLLRMIDNKKFTGIENVRFLQEMQDRLDTDLRAIKNWTTEQISRRTAICLRSLSFEHPVVVKGKDRDQDGLQVRCLPLPWEARSERIVEQPARIQAEIRSLLMRAVRTLYCPLQGVLRSWTIEYYSNPGNHRKPREVKRWMSRLVTGLLLLVVFPCWYSTKIGPSIGLMFEESSIDEVGDRLLGLLDGQDEGSVNVGKMVEEALQFGRSIGIDVEGLVDGSWAGDLVDKLGPSDDTEA